MNEQRRSSPPSHGGWEAQTKNATALLTENPSPSQGQAHGEEKQEFSNGSAKVQSELQKN
jgi:hypothetical protein